MKKWFPFLLNNSDLTYLDNAATTLKPTKIILKAEKEYYANFDVNPHNNSTHYLFNKTKEIIKKTKKIILDFINGNSYEEIVFFPSTTYALNLLAMSCKRWLKKDDEICLTKLEHSSNSFPWEFLKKEIGIKIVFLPLTKQNTIDLNGLLEKINKRTKLVSIFHVSNSLGSCNPIEKITNLIKKKNPNCLIILDAAQGIINQKIDAKKWLLDVIVFSAHKFFGPTGIAAAWINQKNSTFFSSILWGGGKMVSPMDENPTFFLSSSAADWEVGTPPMAQIFSWYKVFKWIKKEQIFEKNKKKVFELRKYAWKELSLLGAEIYSNEGDETSILSFNLPRYHAHDVSNFLSKKNIIVRGGVFCCPYLSETINKEATIRISFVFYNTILQINHLIKSLKEIKEVDIL